MEAQASLRQGGGALLSPTRSHSQGILDEPHYLWHQYPDVKAIGNVSL